MTSKISAQVLVVLSLALNVAKPLAGQSAIPLAEQLPLALQADSSKTTTTQSTALILAAA